MTILKPIFIGFDMADFQSNLFLKVKHEKVTFRFNVINWFGECITSKVLSMLSIRE